MPYSKKPPEKSYLGLHLGVQFLFAVAAIAMAFPALGDRWLHRLVLGPSGPPPGYAVTELAVAAAAMTLQERMGRLQKAGWILILVCFARVETMAISADRRQQDDHFIKTLSTITGGNSFAYLSLRPLGATADNIIPVIVQNGANPVHAVKIMIGNLFVDSGASPYAGKFWELPARDLAVGAGGQLFEYPLPVLGNRMFFMVYFDALNGHWSERITIRKIDGKWVEAIEVSGPSETFGTPNGILYQRLDPGFPTVGGHPDWGDPAL